MFFTIGHSTHALDEFIAMLRAAGARFVADVRTMPRSRTNPQFNTDVLPGALGHAGIGYEHIAALGGLRGRNPAIAPEVNGGWDNASFHNYADYAMTEPFRAGLARLIETGARERCAIMCAEAVWWRCHRRIITDYLLAEGEADFHIVAGDVPEPAKITPNAVARDGVLVYPPDPSHLF